MTQRVCHLASGFCVVRLKVGTAIATNTIADIGRIKPYPRHAFNNVFSRSKMLSASATGQLWMSLFARCDDRAKPNRGSFSNLTR